jgi:hypothetical protein
MLLRSISAVGAPGVRTSGTGKVLSGEPENLRYCPVFFGVVLFLVGAAAPPTLAFVSFAIFM